jgi:hypothetical protein
VTPAVVNDVYRFSVKRIKKKINDFILNNYHELFFAETTPNKGNNSDDAGTSEDSPRKDQMQSSMAAEF